MQVHTHDARRERRRRRRSKNHIKPYTQTHALSAVCERRESNANDLPLHHTQIYAAHTHSLRARDATLRPSRVRFARVACSRRVVIGTAPATSQPAPTSGVFHRGSAQSLRNPHPVHTHSKFSVRENYTLRRRAPHTVNTTQRRAK